MEECCLLKLQRSFYHATAWVYSWGRMKQADGFLTPWVQSQYALTLSYIHMYQWSQIRRF